MPFRQDIQALRGIAVLLVVFYHAKLFPLTGGYLGVDIFFVISGFLITGQVHRQLQNGQFSFKGFYLRRVWRLLPAAYVVFALCALLSPWLLTFPDLLDFKAQLIGAISFSANLVLWKQTGYFDGAAQFKPLLHTWSLSIEEQYYIAVPIILACIPLRKHFLFIVFVTLSSFCTLLYFSNHAPDASFYLTPARIWELGIGSLLALKIDKMRFYKPVLSWAALLLIVLICVVWLLPSWPIQEINNLSIVLATAILILNPIALLRDGPLAKSLAWVGGISYSLYLVHWPVFVFLASINLGKEIPTTQKIFALICSTLLSILLNRYVEQRFRIKTPDHKRTFTPLILCSALLIGVAYSLPHLTSNQNLNDVFAPNWGLSNNCHLEVAQTAPECRNHTEPEMLIWGDSFAMHLVPALVADNSAKLIQLTRLECIPIDSTGHFKPLRPTKSFESDGQACAKFNHHSLQFALNNNNIDTVVLASTWGYVLSPKSVITYDSSGFSVKPLPVDKMKQRLINTIKQLKAAGKKVVLVSPPPSGNVNIAKCHVRAAGQFTSVSNCLIDQDKSEKKLKKINLFMQQLETMGVPIYRFDENLCDGLHCRTVLDSQILYRDTWHFSVKGSKLYGEKFKLYKTLVDMAR